MNKCSAMTAAGKACKAWAVRESDPPLCSAHAGRNVGAGGKAGNSNALKHGFYSSAMTSEELRVLEESELKMSLDDELALMRLSLRRLLKYARDEDLTAENYFTVMKLLFTGARAVVYCEKNRGGHDPIDWDATLDRVGEVLDWDLSGVLLAIGDQSTYGTPKYGG